MLKADFHLHTKEDPIDGPLGKVELTGEQLVDFAKSKGYDVIAITNHGAVTPTKELVGYAKSKGILLIPGVELRPEGKDVVVLNVTQEDIEGIKKISELSTLPEHALVFAPHPFFYRSFCIAGELEKYIHLFDAVEYTHFYLRWLNPNKKGENLAEKHKLPLVGNSDMHMKIQMGTTYTVVDAEKNTRAVIDAIKEGRVRVVTRPLSLMRLLKIAFSWLT